MSRFRLEFDPDGYTYAQEPGVDWQIDGDQLATRTAPAANGESAPFLGPRDNFWHAPGTVWIGTKPRQFDASWNRSVLFEDYVAAKTVWDWTTGINSATNVRDWNPLDIPGTAGTVGGDFMQFTVPASPGTAPLSVNIGAIEDATWDVGFPAGMVVLASTKRDIPGLKTPLLQFRQYPEPEDTILFGFGDVAVLLFSGVVYVLQDVSTGNDLSKWKLRGSAVFDEVDKGGHFDRYTGSASVGSGGATPLHDSGRLRGMMFLPVGFDDIYLLGGAGGKIVQLRDTVSAGNAPRPGPAVRDGKWWFAGFPGQKFGIQFQAVTYHTADHDMVPDPTSPKAIMFDLGNGYAPGVGSAPVVHPFGMFATNTAADPGDIVSTLITAGLEDESTKYHSKIVIQLKDEADAAWISTGSLRRGGLRIELTPGDDVDAIGEPGEFGVVGVFPTQIKTVQMQFPTILTARERPAGMPFTLTDREFRAVNVSTSLRDPLGKRARVLVTENGATAMETAKVTQRSDFPVHLVESAIGDFSDSVIRAAFWVANIEFTEVIFRGDVPTAPVRLYEFEGVGLIHRMKDSPWRYFGNIVAPANSGQLEHTDASSRVIKQSGLDPTDTDFVYIETDTADDQMRRLPGTPDKDPGTTGQRVDNPYAPSKDQDPAAYIAEMELTWAGWLFYQTLGRQVRVQHDPREDPEQGITVTPDATFYRSHAQAAGAGGGVTRRQVYMSGTRERFVRLESNCVSIGGKGLDGKELPILIDEDRLSITDATAVNFVGEPVRPIRREPKMALDRESQGIIARRLRIRKARVGRVRDWENYLAPWDVVPAGLDVGYVVTLQSRGDWLITNIDVALVCPGIVHTRYTGEYMPAASP